LHSQYAISFQYKLSKSSALSCTSTRGRSEEGYGAQCPGRLKVPTMSQVLPSIQYIYSRKTSGSNIGAQNLFLVPRVI